MDSINLRYSESRRDEIEKELLAVYPRLPGVKTSDPLVGAEVIFPGSASPEIVNRPIIFQTLVADIIDLVDDAAKTRYSDQAEIEVTVKFCTKLAQQ